MAPWKAPIPAPGQTTCVIPAPRTRNWHHVTLQERTVRSGVRASSSSSLDEAVVRALLAPVPDDSRAHQELLRRMAWNMGLQAEKIVEGVDPMVNILTPEGPFRVLLPLIKTIRDNTAALWQTLASLAPTATRIERKYLVSSKSGLHIVAAANVREHQGQ